jgi:hypothetical protein
MQLSANQRLGRLRYAQLNATSGRLSIVATRYLSPDLVDKAHPAATSTFNLTIHSIRIAVIEDLRYMMPKLYYFQAPTFTINPESDTAPRLGTYPVRGVQDLS